ncbi:hypothetical protein EHS13_12715 [Paenibacillus psychroresistens]|uniref:Helix-hairpin-helix DNA-binding motif class 1 domain-containing protein n=1 Tax=Paenibacillus psychroresistens TaxID=1778678 RepID=A0A6B8RGU4_9BACL|nr:helix-hairpin-helix domain-containing protein [Paenibacillus psychroresistens]QGQ95681.1 hypothetical protein EHS13_12715 [Paenibacillus psychroresistens]
MWLFLQQYKKVIALCVIPLIAVVGLVGFEFKHGESDGSKPLIVNQEMKALLVEQNDELKASTAPKAVKSPKVSSPKINPTETNSPKIIVPAEVTELPVESTQPETSIAPKKTAKPPSNSKSPKASFMVNVNTANSAELMELSGIGESKAKAIIAYREAHPFQMLDELMNVKGIGPKIFAKIKMHLEL